LATSHRLSVAQTQDEGGKSKEIEIRRARRGDIAAIAALVQKATRSQVRVDEAEVMDWLFGKGLLVANEGDKLVGVAAWQTENLLSVTDVFHVSPARLREEAGGGLLNAIEAEANVLMCEANVMLLPAATPKAVRTFLQGQGYEPKEFGELHRIWREVLNDLVSGEPDLMVKQLRERMVMAPI
jgi:N-acetylglutamate synthase-like GNAT family acetyltransferase